MNVVQLTDTTWMLDGGQIITDDGTVMTVTPANGGAARIVPAQFAARIRMVIAGPGLVRPPPVSAAEEAKHGAEIWTPYREGM